jgi:hypothetical protein
MATTKLYVALVLALLLSTSVQAAVKNTCPKGVFLRGGPKQPDLESRDVMLDIPARRMWGWGNGVDGYCGECSFQMAGIYFGNYVSEEKVRYAAGNTELLIAVNDKKAAVALLYDYEEWDWESTSTPQSKKFVQWARDRIDNGAMVIAGWYERMPKGDPDYDHIMPIVGYRLNSDGTLNGLYHHDLYLNDTTLTGGADLEATRKECSQSDTPKQPYDYCLPEAYDYGIAIKGIKDEDGETFRTKLTIDKWYEPDWGAEDGLHETPVMLGVKATVYGLTVGTQYSILRFDDAQTVPRRLFMNGGWARKVTFTATQETMTIELEKVLSDGTYFYRTVMGAE